MYYDLLVKIKNAGLAKKESIIIPFSKMDFAVAKILTKGNYLRDAQKKTINRKNFIELKLNYVDHHPVVDGFKIISKPSRHIYTDYRSLRPVKSGYGLAVISTPKGIMTASEARKVKVGGEYLFEIW